MFWLYILATILFFILYVKYKHTYWKRRGVYQIEPEFFLGNIRKLLFLQTTLAEAALDRYKEIKSRKQKHGGTYIFLEPVYMPIDPKIIKSILLTDFSTFMDHGLYYNPKDILSNNLFNMEGEQWKIVRAKISPSFSPVKIKTMFKTLAAKKSNLDAALEKLETTGTPCNIKDILSRYSTDVIASCGLGIECNSLEYPEDQFRVEGRKSFEPNLLRALLPLLFSREILRKFNFKSHGKKTTEFFSRLVKDTIDYREKNHIIRKDFLQFLIELLNKKKISNGNVENNGLTLNEIISQCWIFYLAGFETSSSASTFTLLQLCQNPDIQEKARQEILEVLNKYNGEISYDALMEMKYLEKVIDESMRIFPPAANLIRICSKAYKVPGTDLILEKGTKIEIPLWGLQTDPDYFPNPEQFNPENFNEENKAKRPECSFMPFGEGPRICLGMRFGKLQTKFAMAALLSQHKFSLNEKTQLPLKMQPATLVMTIKGDVWLNVSKA